MEIRATMPVPDRERAGKNTVFIANSRNIMYTSCKPYFQIWGYSYMTNDELNAIRTVFREEGNSLRMAFREEINAAVYASETRILARMDERLGQMDSRLGQMEKRLDQMDERLNRVEDRLSKLEIGQQKLRVELSETIAVLNEATKAINDLQQSQRSLEEKFEDNTLAVKRDIQRLNSSVHNFAKEFIEMNGATNDRITAHERTPLDQAHLRPHSAA
jgi:septal ring factor EnvC (AmiA/AmiB activator)